MAGPTPQMSGAGASPGPSLTPPMMGAAAPPSAPPQAVLPGGFDLSRKYPPEYQLLDLATQMVQTALDTGGFIDEADVRAHVVSIHGSMKRLLDNYDAGRAAQGSNKASGLAAPQATTDPDTDDAPDSDTDGEPE